MLLEVERDLQGSLRSHIGNVTKPRFSNFKVGTRWKALPPWEMRMLKLADR